MLDNDKFHLLYLNREGVESDHAILQLKSKGFNSVEFISRWSEAVSALADTHYDAVLVDVNFKVSRLSRTELYRFLSIDQQLSLVIAMSLSDTLELDELAEFPNLELLIKPFSATLLEKCLLQVIKHKDSIQETIGTDNLSQSANNQSGIVFFKMPKNSLGRIDFSEISYIQADGALTNIILTSGGKRTVDLGLKALLNRFNRDDLFQIHKSFAVPIHSIEKVFREEIELVDKNRIPVGRAYKEHFQKKLKEY